jgi:hypothetical protein
MGLVLLLAFLSVLLAAVVGAVVAKLANPPAGGIAGLVAIGLAAAIAYAAVDVGKLTTTDTQPSPSDSVESDPTTAEPPDAGPSSDSPEPLGGSTVSPTNEPSPGRKQSTSAPEAKTAVPSGPDEIVVDVELGTPVTVGKKVGPNVFQLSEWGGDYVADVRYRWQSRAEGVPIEGGGCQILISISGPQDLEGNRSAECSQGYQSQFNSGGTQFRITEPGTYRIRARDSVSGAGGQVTFKVVP